MTVRAPWTTMLQDKQVKMKFEMARVALRCWRLFKGLRLKKKKCEMRSCTCANSWSTRGAQAGRVETKCSNSACATAS